MGDERKMKRSKAFTLLEVMLVLILVVTAFVPLIQSLASGLLAGNEMKGTNFAVMAAQKKIEELKTGGYAAISNEAITSVEGFPAYNRQVKVTTPQTNLKNVQVTIFWKLGGSTYYATFETMVSNL
jgi:type II secretion system protein I